MTVCVNDVYICECVYTHVNAILCVYEFICMYACIYECMCMSVDSSALSLLPLALLLDFRRKKPQFCRQS